MQIKELSWLMENRELLSKEDTKRLTEYNLFDQYNAGEIHQNGVAMLEVLGLVQELYAKYHADRILN